MDMIKQFMLLSVFVVFKHDPVLQHESSPVWSLGVRVCVFWVGWGLFLRKTSWSWTHQIIDGCDKAVQGAFFAFFLLLFSGMTLFFSMKAAPFVLCFCCCCFLGGFFLCVCVCVCFGGSFFKKHLITELHMPDCRWIWLSSSCCFLLFLRHDPVLQHESCPVPDPAAGDEPQLPPGHCVLAVPGGHPALGDLLPACDLPPAPWHHARPHTHPWTHPGQPDWLCAFYAPV